MKCTFPSFGTGERGMHQQPPPYSSHASGFRSVCAPFSMVWKFRLHVRTYAEPESSPFSSVCAVVFTMHTQHNVYIIMEILRACRYARESCSLHPVAPRTRLTHAHTGVHQVLRISAHCTRARPEYTLNLEHMSRARRVRPISCGRPNSCARARGFGVCITTSARVECID